MIISIDKLKISVTFTSSNTNTQIMKTENALHTELFPKFYKGFQHFATILVTDTAMVFTTGAKVHDACDKARLRIADLGLPLEAKVINYNQFIVKPFELVA